MKETTNTTTTTKQDKTKELRAYLKGLSDDEKRVIADKYGWHSCDGHIYSINNQVLLAYQSLGHEGLIGQFAGFRQWLKVKRAVKKGEHGLMIWIPLVSKGKGKDNGNSTSDDGDGDQDTEMETRNGNHEQIRFKIMYVFDISQTHELGNGVKE